MPTPATPHDIPALLRLINSAYRGERSRRGWTTEADFLSGDIRTDASDLAALMARPDAVILQVATETYPFAGCVFLEKRGDRLYLGMLSVLPELQGHGIGKVLLQGAEKHAVQLGLPAIYMRVISLRHELIAWYERHGYRPTGARESFDAPPEFGVPLQPLEFVILEKRVSPV